MTLLFLLALSAESGNGNKTTVARPLRDFTSVDLRGALDAEIREAEEFKVEVTIDENLHAFVTTEVKGGVLTIDESKSLKWKGKGVVSITLPKLDRAESRGSGDLSIVLRKSHDIEAATLGSGEITLAGPVATLKLSTAGSGDARVALAGLADSLVVSTSGSGDVSIAGKTKLLEARTTGSGAIKAEALTAAHAKLKTSGSGDVAVSVTEEVSSASTSGSGDITVYGPAQMKERKQSGSGNIRQR